MPSIRGDHADASEKAMPLSRNLQLEKGTNSIGYGASEGVDNMIVKITYKIRYASA